MPRKRHHTIDRSQVRMCIDVFPPRDEWERFAAIARDEDPTNVIPGLAQAFGVGVVLPPHIAVVTGKKWQNGRTLGVAFLGGTSQQQETVVREASEWSKYINLPLKWGVPASQSDARITFDPNLGSWSYMGTDCLGIPKNQATMNLGWLDGGVVLHEFGHFFSAIHEHQHPQGKIPWNKPAVFTFYGGPPNRWDRAATQSNVIDVYSISQTQFSEYDRKSIMHYAIVRQLLLDPSFAVGWNSTLSASDTKFMGGLYPLPGRPPPPPPPPGRTRKTILVTGTDLTVEVTDG